MIRRSNMRVLVADAGRARWVERSAMADDFVTVRELKAEPPTPGETDGVVFEGSSGRRFNVEEKDEAVRRRRTRFAVDLAEAVNAQVAQGEIDRLAIVAPQRMLAAITQHLSASARSKLVKTLPKDLTKTPDHELGRWLRPLELD